LPENILHLNATGHILESYKVIKPLVEDRILLGSWSNIRHRPPPTPSKNFFSSPSSMSAAPPNSEPPSRLRQHFAGHDPAIHGQKWEELYRESFTPWDRGGPNPALVDLLTGQKDLFGDVFVSDPVLGMRRKRALVPGCGRGYDVLLFSAFGYDAYGLEISESALVGAKKTQELVEGEGLYKARDASVGKGQVSWIAGDFFKDEALKGLDGDGKFDLLYDYTVSLTC
jgi:methyl halide transferase